jgi:hypothetical protein
MEDEIEIEFEGAEQPVVEVEDDTPPEDRGRAPMPKEIVDELEADELEEYSEKVKVRLKQMKKVWHDERRVKEKEQRERQAAEAFAQRLLDENNRLKSTMAEGEKSLVSSYLDTAKMEIAEARRAYKEAYESGDSDAVVDAQEALTNANLKFSQLRSYRPTLQADNSEVQAVRDTQPATPARLDQKTTAWQERNTWFGTDPEMTASALGLHQKLEKQHGVEYVGSDEYWRSIESTMQRRFPEYFGESEKAAPAKPARSETKAATVVAPASRSTSSKRIVLTQSQVQLAKKLGLTVEQYASAALKVEK